MQPDDDGRRGGPEQRRHRHHLPERLHLRDAAGAAGGRLRLERRRSSTSSSSTASSTATSGNNCSVSGSSTGQYTSANYLGGDWAGVTQQITSGYFKNLGVNTLWITVPVQNADTVTGAGELQQQRRACKAPRPVRVLRLPRLLAERPHHRREVLLGSEADLHALVTAAHAAKLEVLFDYAMVDLHTSSPLYTQHVNDSPSWFTPFCQCGDTNNGCSNYDDYKCWFAPYLAHFDFTNSSAARTYSVNAALGLIKNYGNDAFRLDAIKQVDPSWLASLRPQTTTYETQAADGGAPQRFYMVGETYDFDDMAYIRSFINPATALDGQFDFPLRYRLVQAMLLRDSSPMLQPAIPDNSAWVFNQPAGHGGARVLHGLQRHVLPGRRGDEHVHRQPRPAALDSLRRADARLVARARTRRAPSPRTARETRGRASRRPRPTPTRTSGWATRSACSSRTRARRSSTTATRSAFRAREIRTIAG